MARSVLDTFITEFLFETDTGQLRALDQNIDKVRNGLNVAATAFTVLGGAATAAFGIAAKAAIDWESAWTGVLKTVEGTDEQLAVLEQRLRQMAREDVPIDHAELAAIAEAAGQLDVALENIPGFTEVIAKLAATTDLLPQQSAMEISQFANVMEMSQQHFDRFGSTLVDLGNNTATTESKIMNMASRLSGAGRELNLTVAQVLAISAGLSSAKIESEAGGSAMSRVLFDMQSAVATGSKELGVFGAVAGVTGQKFADVFAQDAVDALMLFIGGLRDMSDSGGNVHEALEALGFQEIRTRELLLKSVGAYDKMNEALDLGAKAWEENTALTREAELRFGTTASRIQFLRNNFEDMKIAIGESLLVVLHPVIELLKEGADATRLWAEANPDMVRALALSSAGMLAFGVTLGGVSTALLALQHVVGAWQWLAGTAVLSKLSALTVPLGIIGKALTALGSLFSIKGALIGAALVAIVAAGRAAWTFLFGMFDAMLSRSGEVLEALGRLAEALGLGPLVEGVTTAVSYVKDLLGGLFSQIGTWVSQAWEWLDFSEAGEAFGNAIADGVISAINSLTGFVEWLKNFSLLDMIRDWWNSGGGDMAQAATAGAYAGGAFTNPPIGVPSRGTVESNTSNRSNNINVEKIEVMAPGGDPDTIARGIRGSLAEQLHNAAEDIDDDIDR